MMSLVMCVNLSTGRGAPSQTWKERSADHGTGPTRFPRATGSRGRYVFEGFYEHSLAIFQNQHIEYHFMRYGGYCGALGAFVQGTK